MRRKTTENSTCPFCGKCVDVVNYVNANAEYTVTRRKTKQWFHRTCYMHSCYVRREGNALNSR